MGKISLPETASGYYEIRLESIGGLGANLCGKMLGELGMKYLDLNSTSFSSYGSEKTGTPVKGFIRYCKKDKEIRIHSPIIEPDLLVIFHQALLRDGSAWEGCHENTQVIMESVLFREALPASACHIYDFHEQPCPYLRNGRLPGCDRASVDINQILPLFLHLIP